MTRLDYAPAASGPPLTVYRTQLQQAAGGPWSDGITLGLGFTWHPGLSIPQPVVELAGQDVSAETTLSVDATGRLLVGVDLSPEKDLVCGQADPVYLGVTVTIGVDGASFTGTVSQLCSGPVSYPWRGRCAAPGAAWLTRMWGWTLAGEVPGTGSGADDLTFAAGPAFGVSQ